MSGVVRRLYWSPNISRVLVKRKHPVRYYSSSLSPVQHSPRWLVSTNINLPRHNFSPKRSLATDATPTSAMGERGGAAGDMKVEISPRAAKRLAEIRAKDAKPALALRVVVESGGCHGFQYMMSLTDEFDEEEDVIFEKDGSRVVLDRPSLKLLNGSTIDYTNELIGSSFKVDNPLATSKCGCGTSFDIKV